MTVEQFLNMMVTTCIDKTKVEICTLKKTLKTLNVDSIRNKKFYGFKNYKVEGFAILDNTLLVFIE